MVAVWRVRFRGFLAHRSTGYQRISAAARWRPRTLRTWTRTPRGLPVRCSLVQRSRVLRSGTQIIYVRRILLGHSLTSPAGRTAPPPAGKFRNNDGSSVR
ncbi:hypothetical protein GCM10010266_23190 [Streptomyces griseomycini]|nr:hypothetical protein GCM10010266_23190 [Streptomyces griseomycini]